MRESLKVCSAARVIAHTVVVVVSTDRQVWVVQLHMLCKLCSRDCRYDQSFREITQTVVDTNKSEPDLASATITLTETMCKRS